MTRAGIPWSEGVITSAPLIVYKTADQSKSSDVSLANDDHLFLTVEEDGVYIVECCLVYDCASDGPSILLDFAMGASPADSCFFQYTGYDRAVPSNTWHDHGAMGTGSTTTNNVSPGGTFNDSQEPIIFITGFLFAPSSSDETFALRWAQNVSSATATVVQAGSWMRLTRMN